MKYFFHIIFFFFSVVILAQQTDVVDFKTAKAHVRLSVDGEVSGKVIYSFDVLKDVDSIYLDAKNFTHAAGFIDGKDGGGDIEGGEKHIIIKEKLKGGTSHTLVVSWLTYPKKAMYFLKKDGVPQIWTQGQGKYTSNWLPSIDDMNDKIEFDLTVTFDKDYEVIANGKLINKEIGKKTTRWHYDMQKPMSSYLVALVVGKYNKKIEYSKSGVPLEMHYYPEDSVKFEPTYRYAKRMFDFLEEEIGVPYPWQNYKQVPVHDFLYAGMENTSLTIFADTFVTDSIGFVDKNYVNVNAHELAHQWFGDLVTETSGTHHWLHEGFATYYALLAEKEVFGEDYYYWKLYEYAQQLLDQDEAGGSTSLLNPKSSSLTFYQKGAWVLHMLRERVGDEAFRLAVKNYLTKYQFKNVETKDFMSEVAEASGEDLEVFKRAWLISEKLPYEDMEEYLYLVSTMMKGYFPIDCEVKSECDPIFEGSHEQHKIKAIELLGNDIPEKAFQSNNIKVRQAIAQSLSEIPKELKENYETLLNDKSYATIEAALYHLWSNFPENRIKYLNQTKDVIGFSDKNVRLLWLTLSLVTPEYRPDGKKEMYQELLEYSSSVYGYSIREQAFTYLNSINACNDVCKENLKEATQHHNWRLQKLAKSFLNKNQ